LKKEKITNKVLKVVERIARNEVEKTVLGRTAECSAIYQEKEAVKRAQARRKAVQNEYLNSQLAAAAYEKSSIILPDNPVIQ